MDNVHVTLRAKSYIYEYKSFDAVPEHLKTKCHMLMAALTPCVIPDRLILHITNNELERAFIAGVGSAAKHRDGSVYITVHTNDYTTRVRVSIR